MVIEKLRAISVAAPFFTFRQYRIAVSGSDSLAIIAVANRRNSFPGKSFRDSQTLTYNAVSDFGIDESAVWSSSAQLLERIGGRSRFAR